jgi:HK97 family phage prohead protease
MTMPEDLKHIRAYPTELTQTGEPGARILTGRLVPYNEPASVLDWMPDGKPDIYQEGFRAGAFAPQVDSKNKGVYHKISLIHRHEGGLGFLGPFIALREEPDGLYGDVKIMRTRASDVEDLLAVGVNELSIEFRLPQTLDHTQVDDRGVRWRVRAHLDQVALEPKGAYTSAQVIQFRSELEEHDRQEQERIETNAIARMERQRRFEALTGRLDGELEKQETYLSTYMGGSNREILEKHNPPS